MSNFTRNEFTTKVFNILFKRNGYSPNVFNQHNKSLIIVF